MILAMRKSDEEEKEYLMHNVLKGYIITFIKVHDITTLPLVNMEIWLFKSMMKNID
jgi:hypothetical protein